MKTPTDATRPQKIIEAGPMRRSRRVTKGAARKTDRYWAVTLMPMVVSSTPWRSRISESSGRVMPWIRAATASETLIAVTDRIRSRRFGRPAFIPEPRARRCALRHP